VVLNKQIFQEIQSRRGMAYADCVKMIGSEGRSVSPPAQGMQSYRWDLPDGSYQKLTFAQGRLAGGGSGRDRPEHPIIGTEWARTLERAARAAGKPVSITVDAFERLQNGVSYAECVKTIGSEGIRFSFGNSQGEYSQGDVATFVWSNPDYEARIQFRQDRLFNKMWTGRPDLQTSSR
jgi:hypothetical protein